MKKGFTLLEMLIATTVMSFGIVAIYGLVVHSIEITSENNNKFIVSQLAREGLEMVRNLRDQNWLAGDTYNQDLLSCSLGCEIDYNAESLSPDSDSFLKIDSKGFYNYQTGEESIFKRKIVITQETDFLDIKVSVLWLDNASTTVAENLYDWR